MQELKYGANMLLVKSIWEDKPSFNMIPLTGDCPYTECMFVPQDGGTLVVISRIGKQTLRLLPKLTETGDIDRVKQPRKDSVKDYKEQRQIIETFQEYYITDKEDIRRIVSTFAINNDTFGIEGFLSAPSEAPSPVVNQKTGEAKLNKA